MTTRAVYIILIEAIFAKVPPLRGGVQIRSTANTITTGAFKPEAIPTPGAVFFEGVSGTVRDGPARLGYKLAAAVATSENPSVASYTPVEIVRPLTQVVTLAILVKTK